MAVKFDDHAVDVSFTKNALHLVLAYFTEQSLPLKFFPKLRDATENNRNNWRLIGNGIGVHWPEIDEDIAVGTIMKGHD